VAAKDFSKASRDDSNGNALLGKVLASGATNQVVMALIGFLRVPLVIGTFGPELFASYSAALGFWTLIAAVGESARQRVRIISFSADPRKMLLRILLQSTGVGSLIIVASSLMITGFGSLSSPDLPTFTVAMVFGIFYIPFAMAIGHLEGQFKFASTNFLFTAGQLIGLLVTLLACSLGQIWLVGISVLIPFFIPGLWKFSRLLFPKAPSNSAAIANDEAFFETGSRPMLLLVLLAETLVYAIDGALILRFAGHDQAAIFAVVTRIAAVFAIVPMMVAPLSTALNLRDNLSLSFRKVNQLQRLVGLFLWLFVLVAGRVIFEFLANGQLEYNFWTLLAASTSGLILTFTTTEIQSATSAKLVKIKSLVMSLVATFNIILTISLSPFIGASAAFISTGVGQLIYFAAVSTVKRRDK